MGKIQPCKSNNYLFLLLLFVLWPSTIHSKTIIIRKYSDFLAIPSSGKVSCVIYANINFKGKEIKLPPNSSLVFKNGALIKNGIVYGHNSTIVAESKRIFSNIEIGGTWNNPKVYSQWLDFREGEDNTKRFQNLMQLCNGGRMTHLYMLKGTYYVSSLYRSAPILIPSNVYWHNEAIVRMLPSDMEWYNIVYLNKSENVTIDGGCFIGDVESHKGKTGEWGHGIKCGGASNVTIKNVTCSYCWGDGIDLIEGMDEHGKPTINCDKINIDNVKCFNNRRQGISIEAATNVSIRNSEIAYTGIPKLTSPGAGMDIEPWADNTNKVWNLIVYNCKFHDNKGLDVQCEPNVQKKEQFSFLHNNIRIEKCEIGTMRIQYTKGIVLMQCDVNKYLFVQNTDNIELRKTNVGEYRKGKNIRRLKLVSSKLNTNSELLSLLIPILGISGLSLVGLAKYKGVI